MLLQAHYMFAPFIIPAVTGGIGLIQSLVAGGKQKEEEAKLKAAIANRPTFKPSDYIKNMVADARARANAESPAVRQAYEQARQQAADTMANAERNAVSGSQALGAGAIAQQQVQNISPQLAAQQDAYRQANLARMDNASQAMAQQQALAHQDAVQKNDELVNMYLGRVSAANQAKAMGLSAAIQGGLAAASMINDANKDGDKNKKTNGGFDFSSIFKKRTPSSTLTIPNGVNLSSYSGVPSVNQPPNVQPSYQPFFRNAKFNTFFGNEIF